MFLISRDIFPWDLTILLLMTTGACAAAASIVWLARHHSAKRLQKTIVGFFGSLGFLGFLTVA